MRNVADRGLHEGEEGLESGAAGVGVDAPGTHDRQVDSESSYKPAQSIKRYFNEKTMKRREEAEHWEEFGDDDVVSKRRGWCNPKRLFWEGSRDSQGCPSASPDKVKDIFRHIIMVIMSIILCKSIHFFKSYFCLKEYLVSTTSQSLVAKQGRIISRLLGC